MKRALRATLLGSGMAVLWLLAAPSANAYDYVYLAPFLNAGGYGLNGSYTWAMKTWAIEGQTTRYCNGLGDTANGQPASDAILDWEAQFAFPWNEFTAYCAPGQRMDIVDSRWTGSPCPGAVACPDPTWVFDSTRNGYYIDYVRIWVDTDGYRYTPLGMRDTIAHELGHVYGLHEQYLNDASYSLGSIVCNPSVTSVMNMFVRDSTGAVAGGCGGVNGPAQQDNNNAHEFYVMTTAAFQPQNLRSEKVGTNTMYLYWDDASPAESGYVCMRTTGLPMAGSSTRTCSRPITWLRAIPGS